MVVVVVVATVGPTSGGPRGGGVAIGDNNGAFEVAKGLFGAADRLVGLRGVAARALVACEVVAMPTLIRGGIAVLAVRVGIRPRKSP